MSHYIRQARTRRCMLVYTLFSRGSHTRQWRRILASCDRTRTSFQSRRATWILLVPYAVNHGKVPINFIRKRSHEKKNISCLIKPELKMFSKCVLQWLSQVGGSIRTDILSTLLVFTSVLAVVRIFQWVKQVRSLPPGPWGVPILGYLPFLKGKAVHLHYAELAKKYGSMFSAKLGTHLVVVLSDYRAIRETFRREEFTGRPHTEFNNILGGYGIINTEGALWKDQRKFLHEKLRSMGMTYLGAGKKIMESKIMQEVDSFIRGLTLKRGAPTNISYSLSMAISNVICSITMGIRFQHGDTTYKRFMNLTEEGFKLFGSIVYVNFLPILKYLPGWKYVMNKLDQNRGEMATFFQDTVDQHRKTFDAGNIRDLVDAYLLEIEKAKDEGRELFQGKNEDRQLQQILGDLFTAGMETVKTTLEWAVVMMLHHPEAAIAVQEELDQIVGRSRMPNLEDLPYLPLTEATILEILRRSSIVPMGTTHAATRDVTLDGFTIPTGAHVVPLLHAVHMDPELWDEPETFRPERFLSAEGKVCKPKYFMPFGVGRRMCLGDVLAKMELFLFFSSLLHTFDIRLPEGAALPSLRGNFGITVTPDPFDVCLLNRTLNEDCAVGLAADGTATGPLRNVGSH